MTSSGAGHELRLVGPAVVTWLVAVVLLGHQAWVAFAVAGACGGSAVVALMGLRRALAGAVLACAAASATGVGLRLAAVGSGPVHALAVARSAATVEAVLTGDPHVHQVRGREMLIAAARAESVAGGGEGRVRVRVPILILARAAGWKGLLPGTPVRFSGRLATPLHGELLAAVVSVRGPPELMGGSPAWQRAAETVRGALRRAVDGLPAAERGVLPAMVTGDTSRMDTDLDDAFKAGGLSHLLVVSGENLAIVCGAVLGGCRLAGVGRRSSAVLAAVSVLAFVLVARPDPSVVRAAVMGVIGLLALYTGRERQGLPVLCGAVLVLVLADPELARSYGFILSVCATAGLLLIAPLVEARLERRLPHRIAEVLAIAIAAELACAPVVVMLSGEVCLIAVPANLLAEPAVVPATLLGALAAPVALVALPVARLLVWPAGLAVAWIIAVARMAAKVPYASLPWPSGLAGAFLLGLGIAMAVVVVRRPWARRIAAAVVMGIVLTAVVVRFLLPGWPPKGWLMVVCDVGQGDGIVLSTGVPSSAVVVDAGPDPGLADRCLAGLGIRTVRLLVLTHPHADHIGGVPGLRRGRSVEGVLVSPLSAGEESRVLGDIPAVTALPERLGGLSLTVLGPPPAGPTVSTRDPGTMVNNASVVLVARWPGLSALLPGDVETEAQQGIAGRVPPVDILKVPHHGSSRQDPGFLAATHAGIAITSVGAHNDYGHPAAGTLALLAQLGMRVFRTDRDGDVAIVRTSSGAAVLTRRG